ncbi:MAG: c-type cytochrome [Flavisolibacter sp.]|nr:c-type cytochrome [Flavisolibacter sp.]
MKKSLLVTAGIALMVVGSLAFTNDQPRYKNLKVLPKSTTKEQMDSVMHHFTAALNVKCNYCHVFNQEQKAMDFASDGNEHKGTARQMLRMTQRLNKKYFDIKNSKNLTAKLEVTCYTCHNGKANPARFAAAPQGGPGGPVGPGGPGGGAGGRPDTTRRQQ